MSSPKLYSAKNFIKVNDDALKVLSNNQTFVENTIHLGPSGAGINMGGYGVSNGAVYDNKIAGTFAHRIVNPIESAAEISRKECRKGFHQWLPKGRWIL